MPVGVLSLLGCCCKRTRIPHSDIAAAAIALRSRTLSDTTSREETEAAAALSLLGDLDRNSSFHLARVTSSTGSAHDSLSSSAPETSSPSSVQPFTCSDRGSTPETSDGHSGISGSSSSSGGSRRSLLQPSSGSSSGAFSLLTLEEALRNQHHHRSREESGFSLGGRRRDSCAEAGSPGFTTDSSSSNGNATPVSLDGDEEADLLPGTPTTASSPFSRKSHRPFIAEQLSDTKRRTGGSEEEAAQCSERNEVGDEGGVVASLPSSLHCNSGDNLKEASEKILPQSPCPTSASATSEGLQNQEEVESVPQEEKEGTDEEDQPDREKNIYEGGSDSLSCSREVSDHFTLPQYSDHSLSIRLPSPTSVSRNTSGLTEAPGGGEKDIWISKSPLAGSSTEIRDGDTASVSARAPVNNDHPVHTEPVALPSLKAVTSSSHVTKEENVKKIQKGKQ